MKCKSCNSSHQDQVEKFPVGASVVTLRDINGANKELIVLAGSKGIVGTHCDDGRAYFLFNDKKSAHTFHDPSVYVALEGELQQI